MAVCSNEAEQLSFFEYSAPKMSIKEFGSPEGYKGLAAFHKYWGKKPVECVSFLTELLTLPGEVVVDPFMGSGLIAREAVLRDRNFVGIDINPIAVEMANLQLCLPDSRSLLASLSRIEKDVLPQISDSYRLVDGRVGTHYLWNGETLQKVWIVERGKGGREELLPSLHDTDLISRFAAYQPVNVRALQIFHNSRINARETFTWADLFTGRALSNIDKLLSAIRKEPSELQRALLLSLTSAAGQMSKMVFAITGRGKTTGKASDKVEVGSWVIGYWRPALHFEINVWRCFEKRVKALAKAVQEIGGKRQLACSGHLNSFSAKTPSAVLLNEDCRESLDRMAESSVGLVITDPPHSDRIPYLELSEMWNALFGLKPAFDREIVVSNARKRTKTKDSYFQDMKSFMRSCERVIQPGRFLALMFNARDAQSWEFLSKCVLDLGFLEFCGSFPMVYSANSVVQDNRKGSLKADFILLYRKKGISTHPVDISVCELIPGWSIELPQRINGLKKEDGVE